MRLKQWWRAFWRLLDSESVIPFVWIYYIALLGWGVFATVTSQSDSFVAHGMGVFYWPWVVVQIPATLSVMAGLVWPRCSPSLVQMTDRPDLWLQCAGHSCMFFVLLGYEVVEWPQKDFSLFAIAPYVLGCFFLMLMTGRGAIFARRRR